jgi:predicted MFS family arabinose efflux permease
MPEIRLSNHAVAWRSRPWTMLLALCLGFAMSSAYRSVAAMMAPPLQAEFELSASQLGLFAAAFHFAFGSMQLVMGVGIDVHGLRKTILWALPLAVAGSALAAWAPGFQALLWGQGLIGVGCAPAFLVCTVFIAQRFEPSRFASVSGSLMGLGSVGLLLTGSPLAWLIENASWRAGFAALGAGTALAWLAIFALVKEQPQPLRGPDTPPPQTLGSAVQGIGQLLTMPHTWGILILASVTYAAFMTLRGLWLGPLLMQRFGFSLVHSGHVALAISVVGILGPPLFGRFQAEGLQRRRWIQRFTLAVAGMFLMLAWSHQAWLAVSTCVLIGFCSGFIVLQYADVRASYPALLTGRALAVFTMAMFLGIALMQWLTGWVASLAQGLGADTFVAVNLSIAAMLALGALAFRGLPAASPLR